MNNKLTVQDMFPSSVRNRLIGMDRFIEDFFTHSQAVNFPPYNLIQNGETSYQIEMAVAGFKKENIDIETKDGRLIIRNNNNPFDEHLDKVFEDKQKNDNYETLYIHRGIATRNFEVSFALGEYIEIKGAEMKDGMLVIKLEKEIPEEKKPKKINIQ